MKPTLQPGLEYTLKLLVSDSKTVPALYPESPEFQVMPHVFATGFLVGFFEWACIRAVNPHLDWPAEQTVGTHIHMSHLAATPPGMEVVARVMLTEVEGRRLRFELEASDGAEVIARGNHERFVVDAAKFTERTRVKAAKAGR